MILPLSELLRRAIEQTLEDRIAISFSGGLDSTLIAAVAKKCSQVELFSAGVKGCEDLEFAEKAAAELGLPLSIIDIDENKAMETYTKCYAILPMDFLKVEILVPVYLAAQAASEKGHKAMLFGSAAEELFAGYDRYYLYREEGKDVDPILREEFKTLPHRDMAWVKKICRCFDIEARFPYHDKALSEMMFAVPISERMDDRLMKKGILREAAKVLGVPDMIVRRKKKAMQYGSGVHKMLMKRVDEINLRFPGS
jgi:asparagine synthase (glutamine-hydrolysing)